MEKQEFLLKNFQLIKIWRSLSKLENSTGGSVEFKFGMSVNRNTLKPMIEAIDTLQKPSEEIVEYSKKYHDLLKSYEEKGLPNEEIREPLEKDILDLNEEYKTSIEERNGQMKEFDKFLNDSTKIDLYPATTEDILAAFKAIDPKLVSQEDLGNLILLSS